MPPRAKYIVGFTAIAGSVALHTPAMAASFDCSLAKAPREQLICSDPALSNLDEQLGRKYQERRTLLSPTGAELLQRSEQSWLHFIAIACPLAPSGAALPPKYCLQGKYKERLTQLEHAGEKFGPFVFNRIDLYAAVAVQEDSGPVPGFSIRHTAYPQIDVPNSPQAEAWNKANASEPSEAGDCPEGEHLIDYEIGYASQNVISMRRSESEYCGGAHGMSWSQTGNTVLLPNPRSPNAMSSDRIKSGSTSCRGCFGQRFSNRNGVRPRGWRKASRRASRPRS
jgi:uncharacterized protein